MVSKIGENPFTPEENASIYNYLLEQSEKQNRLLRGKRLSTLTRAFWNEFIEKTGTDRKVRSLYNRTQRIFKRIHKCDFDAASKLQLFLWFRIEVSEQYRHELEKDADIKISPEGWLEEYQKKTPILKPRPRPRPKTQCQIEQELKSTKLCEFLLEKSRETIVDPNELSIYEDFKKRFECADSAEMLRDHFQHDLIPSLHFSNFDLKTKAEMYHNFNVPVCFQEIRKLREIAEFDENGFVVGIIETPNNVPIEKTAELEDELIFLEGCTRIFNEDDILKDLVPAIFEKMDTVYNLGQEATGTIRETVTLLTRLIEDC